MPCNQFTLSRVQADFGPTVSTVSNLFPGVPPAPTPAGVRDELTAYTALAVTEAGRSHHLIAPLLGAVWRAGGDRIALFPGVRFDADADAELTGTCDFILGRPPQLNYVTAPLLMAVEAKNEDMWAGVGQCAAELVAAQRFNAGKNSHIGAVYGAVSDGQRWRFLRLSGQVLVVEPGDRMVADPDVVYGILLHVCGLHPTPGGE